MNKTEKDISYELIAARLMAIGGIIFVPTGYLLDIFIYPDNASLFLKMRVLLTITCIIALLFLYFKKQKLPVFWIISMGFIASFAFALMCNISGEGYKSDYYLGIVQVMFFLVCLPTSTSLYIFYLSMMYVTYLFVMHIITPVPYELSYFVENTYFIIISMFVLVVAHYFIRHLRVALKEANDKNYYMAKIFAHDLKNDIAAMEMNYATKKNSVTNAIEKDELEAELSHLAKMKRITGNMINIFTQEDIKLHLEPIESKTIIGYCSNQWHSKFEAKKVQYSTEDLFKGTVSIDEEYMKLAWDNLCSNALNNTSEGGIFKIVVKKQDADVTISFLNSGALIPLEHRNNLFAANFALGKRSVYQKGLGLPYCKMIAEKHGGCIQYIAHEETGMNEFVVRLPVE